ncbi:hypothetical protein KKF84_16405 [Myxococcota bacterium]|nr:hypothetical protein [Myxococcota bacterium]MBU1536908.1 hypothetical protein [Myxococcota bacterium]
MKQLLFLLIVTTLGPGCGRKNFPLNLRAIPFVPGEVAHRAASVDYDFPGGAYNGSDLYYRQVILQGTLGKNLSPAERRRVVTVRKRLKAQLARGDVAWAYPTTFEGKPALHEFAAGILPLSLDAFAKKMTPAKDWGRLLRNYRGGSFTVDRRDDAGRIIFARERMVLATPWYAIGSPLLDMSKYEETVYGKTRVIVYWEVKKSANASVMLDIGYVRFSACGSRKTCVFFNSIHRVDPGWGARLMPGRVVQWLSQKVLRDLFSGHIRNYRRHTR